MTPGRGAPLAAERRPRRRRVARVDVAFVALPPGSSDRKKGVNLTDQVMARHSDPNLAKWDPATRPSQIQCV